MPRPTAGLRLAALALAALPAISAAESSEPSGQGSSSKPAETKLWGSAYFQVVAADALSAQVKKWGVAQETGLALNLRSAAGLELLSDFVIPVSLDRDLSLNTVLQQLAVRLALSDSVTLVAGKQRLNWGTAKIFSAIDTLEARANPIDVRSILAGVAGVKAVFIPTDWLSFSLVGLPASELRYSGGAARADFVAEDLGLDLGFGVVKYTHLDWSAAAGTTPEKLDRVALMSDGAWSAGSLVLYEETQLRWGRETGYQLPAMAAFNDLGGRDQAVLRGVGGMMLQLDLGLKRPALLVAEYLYNGDGLTTGESRAFAADYAAWQDSGYPSGARVPAAFTGIGGFRRHYLSAALQNVAVNRYLLLGASGILGLDSRFSRIGLSLEWDPTQQTSIAFRYEYYMAFLDGADQPTELLLIPFRHRAALTFTTSY